MSDSTAKGVGTTIVRLRSIVTRPWAIVGFLFLCLVVGIVLDALGFTPESFFVWLYTSALSLLQFIWNSGLGIVWPIARFVLIGASVILPIWAVIIAIRYLRGRRTK
jgi:hypothetical protein